MKPHYQFKERLPRIDDCGYTCTDCVYYHSCEVNKRIKYVSRRKATNFNKRAKDLNLRHNLGISKINPDDIEPLIRESMMAGMKCCYCGGTMVLNGINGTALTADKHLSIDHVISMANGGANTVDNLVVCCHKCNKEKSIREKYQNW